MSAGWIVLRRGGLLEGGKPDPDVGEIGGAGGGQAEILAAEQFAADVCFELAYAMTDGARGHAQFVGRAGGAAQAGERLKGEQALNGRNVRGRHRGLSRRPGGASPPGVA